MNHQSSKISSQKLFQKLLYVVIRNCTPYKLIVDFRRGNTFQQKVKKVINISQTNTSQMWVPPSPSCAMSFMNVPQGH